MDEGQGRVMRVMRTTIFGNLCVLSRKSAASLLGKQLLHKENNRGKQWKAQTLPTVQLLNELSEIINV